jgi:hypothetical protein
MIGMDDSTWNAQYVENARRILEFCQRETLMDCHVTDEIAGCVTDIISALLHLARDENSDPIDVLVLGIQYWAAEEKGAEQLTDDLAIRLTGGQPDSSWQAREAMMAGVHSRVSARHTGMQRWLNL